jgi:hypothetical protein
VLSGLEVGRHVPVVAVAQRPARARAWLRHRLSKRSQFARRAAGLRSVFDKPLIIGEFAFRGADSGLPNTRGAGPIVKTQTGRAVAFERYVTSALSQPNVVGFHWFEHADESKQGRFDGEDSNYGIVNIRDEPYEVLLGTMHRIHDQAEALHRKASH